MIRRGDIRWVRIEHPDKRRPVLVLERDQSLEAMSEVTVVPISSQLRGLPWEVRLSETEGFPVASVLKLEWIKTVGRDKLGPFISSLPPHRWPEVRRALLEAMGFEDTG